MWKSNVKHLESLSGCGNGRGRPTGCVENYRRIRCGSDSGEQPEREQSAWTARGTATECQGAAEEETGHHSFRGIHRRRGGGRGAAEIHSCQATHRVHDQQFKAHYTRWGIKRGCQDNLPNAIILNVLWYFRSIIRQQISIRYYPMF